MEQMTVGDVVAATSGKLLCGSKNTPLYNISIDSRTMKGSDLFVPLIGEKVDAHRFIEQAVTNGAAAVLTSEHSQMNADTAWISVDDTKKALQHLGCFYRNRLSLPLIGVTGSVGKTTTREMIAAALSAKYRVYKTPGNHNSQIGVPITLSEITSKDQIGVIELGMSEPGELTVIAQIAQPDMAVITNVGVTHIEQLGSQENIYQEKLSIQDGLKAGGILFLNGDDKLLKQTTARAGYQTIYYGTGSNSDYRADNIILNDGYPEFTAVHGETCVPVRLNVMGKHNILNAMVALAVADCCGIPMEKAVKALESFQGFQNRQQVYQKNGITVIDDTYNASPVSMKAGLDILASLPNTGRKIAVLADMKELGDDTIRFHQEVGEYLSSLPVTILYTYGDLAKELERAAKQSNPSLITKTFDNRQELFISLEALLQTGDSILLKGSNSMKLGEIVSGLLKEKKQV